MRASETRIDIDAPAALVWDALVDFDSYENEHWNTYIRAIRAELTHGASVTADTYTPQMGERPLKAKMLAVTYPELSWEKKLPIPGIIHARHWFHLEELSATTCRLTQGEQLSGILAPLFFPLVRKSEEGFTAYNEALKERVETAHPATA